MGACGIRRRRPLVLLDLHVPDSDAYETLASVPGRTRGSPVVVLASANDTHLIEQALGMGQNGSGEGMGFTNTRLLIRHHAGDI